MGESRFLTVDQALDVVLSGVTVLPAVETPLLESLGTILASPIEANSSLPAFANSSMDGYAVRATDISEATPDRPVTLRVVGDIAAGVNSTVELTLGTAARIMTGAMMPDGADSVVPVELTNENWRDSERPLADQIEIRRHVSHGDYVRLPGEDIQAGAKVFVPGTQLRPQEIGLLAALGHSHVNVFRKPRIGIVATGDELIDINEPISAGKIRNSNSYALAAQILSAGAEPVNLGIARDTVADVRSRLQEGVELGVDLIVSSAGVSVGAYDVVKTVLDQDGDITFWRVRMRPGKPLAFGSYSDVPFLGLPGNPVSALVSFERFGRPMIRKMAGHARLDRPLVEVEMTEEMRSDGRETYVRAIVERNADGYSARPTGRQGSHIQTSLARANALVIIPEGQKSMPAGSRLKAMMLNWPEDVF